MIIRQVLVGLLRKPELVKFYNNGSINNLFEYYSTAIHRANYHYYLISTMTNVAEKEKNNALGELRFLKWAEFELVRRFGPFQYLKRLLMREMILTSLELLLRRYMKILLQI